MSNIQSFIDEDNLDRVHLLTKKICMFISVSFDISDKMRNSLDGISVEILINELRTKPDHPIIYYKPQDTVNNENPVLNHSDFLAIFKSKTQK